MGKTATAPKNRKKISEKKNMPLDPKMLEMYASLKVYLSQLEIENKKLEKDLVLKRKNRAEALKQARSIQSLVRRRMEQLESGISRGDELARKQERYLLKMKQLYRQNAKKLMELARRLDAMEEIMSHEGSEDALRFELIGMLSELKVIREKREKLENLTAS